MSNSAAMCKQEHVELAKF